MKTTYLSYYVQENKNVDHSQATQDDILVTKDGRHKFLKTLANGKSGTAYLFSGNKVVKGFHSYSTEENPELVADAKSEAEIFNRLYEKEYGKAEVLVSKNPFTVRLIMPLVPGVPLADFKKFNPVDLFKHAIDLLRHLRAWLEPFVETRKSNIIFNDIHPNNILVDINGKCRLIDFGRSQLLDDLKENERVTRFHSESCNLGDIIKTGWLKNDSWPFPKSDDFLKARSELRKIVDYLDRPICKNPEADWSEQIYEYPTIEKAIEKIDHLLDELKCTDKSTRFFEPYVRDIAKARSDLYIDPSGAPELIISEIKLEPKTIFIPSTQVQEKYPNYYSTFTSQSTSREGVITLLKEYVWKNHVLLSGRKFSSQVQALLDCIEKNTSVFPDAPTVLDHVNKSLKPQISKCSETSPLYKRLNFLKAVIPITESSVTESTPTCT